MNLVKSKRDRVALSIVTALTVVASLSGLSGCALSADRTIDCNFPVQAEKFPEGGRDVAVVISPTSNFVDFSKALEAASGVVTDAIGDKGARVSIILADGKPGLVRQTLAIAADSEQGQKILNDQLIDDVRNVYYCVTNDEEHATRDFDTSLLQDEVDMMEALSTAMGAFDPATKGPDRRIVVIGNAIQTVGQFDFVSAGLPRESEVGSIVDSLSEEKALPKLNAVRVDFVGLGLVNESQPSLNQQSKDGITIFWSRLIEASGGLIGTLILQVPQGTPTPGSLSVSQVESLKDACINQSVAEADGITFQPDQATFVDVSAATATASILAAKIAKSNCSGDLTVIGYVTSGVKQSEFNPNDEWNRELSQRRAEAFKSLLVAAGVTSNIVVVGGGKGPINEWDASGNYVADEGAKNRKVVVTQ